MTGVENKSEADLTVTHIESKVTNLQKEIDKRRAENAAAAKKRGNMANQENNDDAASDGFNTKSGVINLDQYLRNMRKEPSSKKPKKKMITQGNDTFEEIKLALHDFHLRGQPSSLKRAMSRKKREAATD